MIGVGGVLGSASFRRYFVGQTLSTFGDSLVPLTLAFASLALGGPLAVGVVLAANRVPVALLVLFGGALGDRWDRRSVMLGADVLRGAAQGTSGVLLVTGHASVGSLVVLQAVSGVGTALFVPAASALVPALVPGERVQQANALLGLSSNVNKVVSISAAGGLVALWGPGPALLVDAATFGCSAVSLTMLRIPPAVRTVGRRSLVADVRAGWRLVVRTRWLRAMLGYQALLQALVIGPHMVAGPLLAARMGGAAAWATIGVVQAVGSIVGGALALRIRPRRPIRAVLLAALVMVPYLVLFAVGAPLWIVSAAALLVGVQGSYGFAVQATVLQTRVPDGAVARASAWSQLGNLVLLPGSLALAGPVVAFAGGSAVLLTGAGWLVVSSLIMLVLPAVRDVEKDEAAPAGVAGAAVAGQ